jgi:hypothetical protein
MAQEQPTTSAAISKPLSGLDIHSVGTARTLEQLWHQLTCWKGGRVENRIRPNAGTGIHEHFTSRIPRNWATRPTSTAINRNQVTLQSMGRQLLSGHAPFIIHSLIYRRNAPLLPHKQCTTSPVLTLPAIRRGTARWAINGRMGNKVVEHAHDERR